MASAPKICVSLLWIALLLMMCRKSSCNSRHGGWPDNRPLYRRKPNAAEVQITRPAHGVPVGGELDYLDEGTLAQAAKARRKLEG